MSFLILLKLTADEPEHAFPRTRWKKGVVREFTGVVQGKQNIRFPWMNIREPDTFHSLNISSSKNHFAVPKC